MNGNKSASWLDFQWKCSLYGIRVCNSVVTVPLFIVGMTTWPSQTIVFRATGFCPLHTIYQLYCLYSSALYLCNGSNTKTYL